MLSHCLCGEERFEFFRNHCVDVIETCVQGNDERRSTWNGQIATVIANSPLISSHRSALTKDPEQNSTCAEEVQYRNRCDIYSNTNLICSEQFAKQCDWLLYLLHTIIGIHNADHHQQNQRRCDSVFEWNGCLIRSELPDECGRTYKQYKIKMKLMAM